MWCSMTIGLIGSITCLTVFIVDRFTNFNIIEEEKAFNKSPHLISTLGSIAINKVTSEIDNKISKKSEQIEVNKNDEVLNGGGPMDPSMNAVLLVREVVTKAASAANKSRLQYDKDL